MERKLGRLPAKRSMKSIALGNYMTPSKVAFPPVMAWERPIEWGMLLNDQLGDCTVAAVAHQIMAWQAVANAGTPFTVTDEQVKQAYADVSDFDPVTGTHDDGAVELDVLRRWQTFGLFGHKIAGYATLDVQNIDQIKAAIYLFGGVYIGFDVPAYIMEDTGNHHWRIQNQDTQILGGHAVTRCGYGRNGNNGVSWGDLYTMSWDFWQQYVEEAYAVVSPDWIKQSGTSPTGLDLNGLIADLAQV